MSLNVSFPTLAIGSGVEETWTRPGARLEDEHELLQR
jgi:hypothetical protein